MPDLGKPRSVSAMGTKIDAGFSNLLNFCRWMAAFLVVISHVRGLVFPAAGAFDPHDLISTSFYFITGFGHSSVILFFVLSGYLVGGNALADFRSGLFSPRKYFIARASRIYTVFLPALLLVLVLDFTGARLFVSPGFYTHPPSLNSLYFSIVDRLDGVTLLGNLAMLQTILVEPFGSDAPLWSLANEWWYYMLFGLLLWLSKGRPPAFRMISAIAIAAATAALFPRQISLWFLIWLAGSALAIFEPRRRIPLGVGLALFLTLFGAVRIPWVTDRILPSDFVKDGVVALGFCLFLVSARQAPRLPLMGHRINGLLADFSYSVYLFHFPLLIFLGSMLGEMRPLPGLTGVMGGVCFLLLLVPLYLASYGLSRVTEAKTPQIRALMQRCLVGCTGKARV